MPLQVAMNHAQDQGPRLASARLDLIRSVNPSSAHLLFSPSDVDSFYPEPADDKHASCYGHYLGT